MGTMLRRPRGGTGATQGARGEDAGVSAGAGPEPADPCECSLPRSLPWDPGSQFMEQSAIADAICRLIFADLLHERRERCVFSFPKREEENKSRGFASQQGSFLC